MSKRFTIALALAAAALPAIAQMKQLPMEPLHESGQSVTPSYEGWWQNPDGTYSLMFGYFNRNTKETPDVPIGPNNHIDPGPADQGQPTHFVPRRQWGVFTVTAPKDIGTKKITWTIIANGQMVSVPSTLDPNWNINPMSEIGIGNTPPTISFDEKGPSVQGPKPLEVQRAAKVGVPLALTVWAADDDKRLFRGPAGGGRGPGGAETNPPVSSGPAAVTLTWQKFRGPGEVKFSTTQTRVEAVPGSEIPVKNTFNGKSTNTATFSEPGDYILRVIANDSSGPGGGGFLCCWTNGEVKVTVR
ncbi:MAG TPA: hypothetical protein VG273_01885 [Bryobacteraceae bacterium]|jgi:hypothetical protein|nr:hypothetical protein [Bryobacteraceae bacterium]